MAASASSTRRNALAGLIIVIVVGLAAGFAVGILGPHSTRVDSIVNIIGGIALVAIAAMMLWQLRSPAATPEAQTIRGSLRTLAASQGLLGLSFFVPDVRVHAAAMLIVIVPSVIAVIRMRQAMKTKHDARQ